MSDADKAFEAAQKLIAEREAIATIDLHLGAPDFRALEALPSSIADLIELTELSLANTQVRTIDLIRGLASLEELILSNTPIEDLTPLANLSNLAYVSINQTNVTDISPISGLTKISALSLDDTPILDLRPVLSLIQLKNDPTYEGLTFRNTLATRSDVRIGKIAEIGDPEKRATELFDYLENWQLPVVNNVAPQQDLPAGAHFALGVSGRLALTDPVLTEEDPQQQELHQDCRDKAHRLVGTLGQTNEFGGLKSSAEKYREVISRPASAIGARRLWSVGNTLNVALEAQLSAVAEGRDTDKLPPLVAAALRDLMDTHSLFGMGHPGMAEVIRLIREATHGPRNATVLAAAGEVVASLNNAVAVIEPDALAVLNDDRNSATGVGLAAAKAETGLVGSLRNMIATVGRAVWSATRNVTGLAATTAVVAATTGVVGIWIAANKTLIEAFLLAQQGQIQPWVAWLLSLF